MKNKKFEEYPFTLVVTNNTEETILNKVLLSAWENINKSIEDVSYLPKSITYHEFLHYLVSGRTINVQSIVIVSNIPDRIHYYSVKSMKSNGDTTVIQYPNELNALNNHKNGYQQDQIDEIFDVLTSITIDEILPKETLKIIICPKKIDDKRFFVNYNGKSFGAYTIEQAKSKILKIGIDGQIIPYTAYITEIVDEYIPEFDTI